MKFMLIIFKIAYDHKNETDGSVKKFQVKCYINSKRVENTLRNSTISLLIEFVEYCNINHNGPYFYEAVSHSHFQKNYLDS
jgi:hypothetical protein